MKLLRCDKYAITVSAQARVIIEIVLGFPESIRTDAILHTRCIRDAKLGIFVLLEARGVKFLHQVAVNSHFMSGPELRMLLEYLGKGHFQTVSTISTIARAIRPRC